MMTHSTKCKECDTLYYQVDESAKGFYVVLDKRGEPEIRCTECSSLVTFAVEVLHTRDLIREHFTKDHIYYPEVTPKVLCPKCEGIPEPVEPVLNFEREMERRASCAKKTLEYELFSDTGRLSPEIAKNLKRLTHTVYHVMKMNPPMEYCVPLNTIRRETHIPTEVIRDGKPPKLGTAN